MQRMIRKKENSPLIHERSGLGNADFQHGETVREGMRRVPDHEDGAVAEDAEDGLHEPHFVVGVEMSRGFVEEQDACAAEEFACEGKTKAFACGEISCGFGEHGVELVRQCADDGIGSGGVERVKNGIVGGCFAASEREVGA